MSKKLEKQLEDIENKSLNEPDSVEMSPSDIVSYNELRSCADLFRMYKDKILDIQPDFQREKIWPGPARTRFIDSLIKQLPIPSMCFSLDNRQQKWQVVDGLQRIATIIDFLDKDSKWVLSTIKDAKDIDPQIVGQPVSRFHKSKSKLNQYLARVKNVTLPITVIRCDYNNKSHTNYIFTIFHRLNTGGTKLNNQEIRNCIFSGPFNDCLKTLGKRDSWKKLMKIKKGPSNRYTEVELILRLLAFRDNYKNYNGKFSKFLNDYMSDNRFPSDEFLQSKTEVFDKTIHLVLRNVFDNIPPTTKISNTVLEALLVGVSLNIDFLEKKTGKYTKSLYRKLLARREFSEKELVEGLAAKSKVIKRLSVAQKVFSGK